MMSVRELMRGAILAGAVVAMPALAAEEASVKQAGADIRLPPPPKGKGQVVFYRKGGLQGSAVACSVFEGDKKISSLGGGKYFIVVEEPGRHEFKVKTEATDVLALEVEADETQFAACKIKMGIMVGRPDIRPSTEADFRGMKALRLVDTDDMGEGALRPDQIKAALDGTAAPVVADPAIATPAAAAPEPAVAAPATEPAAAAPAAAPVVQ